jgi:DNA-binding MarR family transcriptional regulator
MAENKIESVLIALRRVIRATDLHSRNLIKTAGLTGPQLLLLRSIRDNGDHTIGELSSQISLSQATVTTILDRLERRGLVYRLRSTTDKRKVHVHLTPAGIATLDKAPMPLQESFVRRFEQLHEWEQSAILSSLQRVATMMDAETIDFEPLLDLEPGTLAVLEAPRRRRSSRPSA